MTFICVSVAIYVIAAILSRYDKTDITSIVLLLFLPLAISAVMMTSSKAPTTYGLNHASGWLISIIFLCAFMPTLKSITTISDLITNGRNGDFETKVGLIIWILGCVPVSIFINSKIAKLFCYYFQYRTVMTYIVLVLVAAGTLYLIFRKPGRKAK